MSRAAGRLRLVVITPGEGDLTRLLELCLACLENGASALWIRERSRPREELESLLLALSPRADDSSALLICSGHEELAASPCLSGLHLGFRDDPPARVRERVGPAPLLGFSGHDPLDPDWFGACDYITLSPLFAVPSKPLPALGLERFRALASLISLPVVALGGIGLKHAAAAMRAGADGVAVMRAVTAAADPGRATARLRMLVEEARP
ncbi:MAG: thiamine phosphate synthase [Planctomycetota bacterium]